MSNNPVHTKQQQPTPNQGNIFTSAKSNENTFVKSFEPQNNIFTASSNGSNANRLSRINNEDVSCLKKEERLDRMPWFHGLLTRENAEKLLVKDGDYLVRETNKAEKQYVLSGRYKGECRHIFLVDPSGVVTFIMLSTTSLVIHNLSKFSFL